MQRKDVPIGEVKADGEAGVFTALASVFNNIDSVGDKVLPGHSRERSSVGVSRVIRSR